MSELLDVINEHDEVVGQAERDEVHRVGLLCRLVYVCFYTPGGKIILQKRSTTKKNDPGKLTTTVSGHVGSGQNYFEATLREALEETSIQLDTNKLSDLGVIRVDYTQGTYLSNARRGLFVYRFEGDINELEVEDGDGAGFVSLTLTELEQKLHESPEDFAAVLTGELGKKLIQGIKKLL